MLLRKEESDAQGQQLPALWEIKGNPFDDTSSRVETKHPLVFSYLCQGVVVRHPLVGLLDQLTVHLILELRMRQAHLQGILGQRGVVINRGRLHQHVDEELTGLQRKEQLHLSTGRGRYKRTPSSVCGLKLTCWSSRASDV